MEGHFPNNVKVVIGWLIIVKTCVYLQYLAMRNMWISVPFLFMLWRPRLLLQAHPLEVAVPAPGRKSFCAKSFALTALVKRTLTALVKRKQTAEVDWYMYHWVNHEILTRHTVLMTPQYIYVMCCASQGSHIDWFADQTGPRRAAMNDQWSAPKLFVECWHRLSRFDEHRMVFPVVQQAQWPSLRIIGSVHQNRKSAMRAAKAKIQERASIVSRDLKSKNTLCSFIKHIDDSIARLSMVFF